MATELRKPVRRKTSVMVRDQGARRIVVTLYPVGLLGLRPERTRREEFIGLADCWSLAVKVRVAAERAKKLTERRERRAGR